MKYPKVKDLLESAKETTTLTGNPDEVHNWWFVLRNETSGEVVAVPMDEDDRLRFAWQAMREMVPDPGSEMVYAITVATSAADAKRRAGGPWPGRYAHASRSHRGEGWKHVPEHWWPDEWVPNPAEIYQEDAEAAVDKYKEFHRYDPRHLDEIEGLEIPRRVRKLGAAKYVLYRSGKVDPSTLQKPRKPVDYIHEHDAGVTIYVPDGDADTDVPREVCEATALVRLGACLGFALRDGTKAEGKAPLPDLCCTPDGKCLLVVQGRKKVLAMFWGGALGVFARGIDG